MNTAKSEVFIGLWHENCYLAWEGNELLARGINIWSGGVDWKDVFWWGGMSKGLASEGLPHTLQ